MEVTGGNIWHATNTWSRFTFLGDQTIHIKFNCIQSLQYLHLFTYTYNGLLCRGSLGKMRGSFGLLRGQNGMAKSALLEPIRTKERVKIGPYFVANLGQCMVKQTKF